MFGQTVRLLHEDLKAYEDGAALPPLKDALDKAREIKPTLMLLDVMMPKLNGLQVLEKLKADPETKAIPVIMLTNLAGEQDAEAALAKGAIKYIIKSEYEPKEVADMVKEVLAGYTRGEVPGASA